MLLRWVTKFWDSLLPGNINPSNIFYIVLFWEDYLFCWDWLMQSRIDSYRCSTCSERAGMGPRSSEEGSYLWLGGSEAMTPKLTPGGWLSANWVKDQENGALSVGNHMSKGLGSVWRAVRSPTWLEHREQGGRGPKGGWKGGKVKGVGLSWGQWGQPKSLSRGTRSEANFAIFPLAARREIVLVHSYWLQ